MAVFDKSGMYEILESMHEQVMSGYELAKTINIDPKISNVVICGVGGSIIAGHILKQYLKNYKFPIFVVEDFELPSFVDKYSLVFILSYTGNSEESIHMYKDALKRDSQIICIGAGGKLRAIATNYNTKYILTPNIGPSRLAYAYMFFPMLKILENSRLIEEQSDNVKRVINSLKKNKYDDVTENIADKLKGKIPIIYSSKNYEAVSLKWKLNFNENSEMIAFSNVFPSAMHNEIACFSNNKHLFYVLLVKSEDDDYHLKKKNNIVKEILREEGIPVTEIAITGDCYLVRLFTAIFIGDFLSYHLAIKRGIDPTPTRIVEELKKRMLS